MSTQIKATAEKEVISLNTELKLDVLISVSAQITLTMYEKKENLNGKIVKGDKIKSVQIQEKCLVSRNADLFKVDSLNILKALKSAMIKNAKSKTNLKLIAFLNANEINDLDKVQVQATFKGAFFVDNIKMSAKDIALIND